MAFPKLDDIAIEFEFSQSENIAARTLNEVQIMWFRTQYARTLKLKASALIPEDQVNDRSFLLKIAELDGKLTMIQEILEAHKQAQLDLQVLSVKQAVDPNAGNKSADDLGTRASALVNKQF